jgi:hypothetical protein
MLKAIEFLLWATNFLFIFDQLVYCLYSFGLKFAAQV